MADPTDAERPTFVAWARSRPGFRPLQADGLIPILGGAVMSRGRPQTLADLADRWRSLGRPGARTRLRRPKGD